MFVRRDIMFSPFSWCFNNSAEDGYVRFAVVSEYFGRGLFNKVTVVTDEPAPSVPPPVPAPPADLAPAPAVQTYGPGAEAKLRLQEGQSKQVFVSNAAKQMAPKGSSVVPVPEGRMRILEQQQYSSSLEANMTRLEPAFESRRDKVSPSTAISSAIANGNPFEETYDEAKNPFAESEGDPMNPFTENDDYDKNLNPFA